MGNVNDKMNVCLRGTSYCGYLNMLCIAADVGGVCKREVANLCCPAGLASKPPAAECTVHRPPSAPSCPHPGYGRPGRDNSQLGPGRAQGHRQPRARHHGHGHDQDVDQARDEARDDGPESPLASFYEEFHCTALVDAASIIVPLYLDHSFDSRFEGQLPH